ncbi:MAG: hypothetical protein JEZ06_21155 [Anaerolineaceae bacterium]|nr:hypothetical protein [Anaerolineaceae bacterium]
MKNEFSENENHIPIIIGNHEPFRIIVRETDEWNPTLEQINYRDYDYVKLNRMSAIIDIGIRPFSLGIGFDGSLVLPATNEFQNRENVLVKFNESLGFLLLGGVYSESVQPENISFGQLHVDGYIKILGGGSGLIANFHKSIRTKLVGTIDVIRLLEPQSLKCSEIEDSYKKGKLIFNKLKNLSSNLLLEGTSNYVRHQWAESLIFLRTSIEQIIDLIWEKEIIGDNIPGVIIGRMNFLKDYRTWTSSARIELLFQKEIISLEVYQFLNSARKARNDFIHNGKQLTEDKVKNALEGLFRLISLVISNYESSNELNNILELIYRNQRGDLIPKKTVFDKKEVKHYLEIPPLPGDSQWKDKEYEIIEELVLKPIKEI